MPEFGWSSLLISFLLAATGVLFTGSRFFLRSFNDEEFFTALAKIRLASLVGVSVAYFVLVCLFLQDRFDVVAVYKFSEASLDPIYKVSASWSGMEGSLLFWTLNLSIFANLGLARYATYRGYLYYFVSLLFLLFVTLFLANPFKYTEAFDISDGLGMNPLLHNVYMLVHPIIIYAGLNSTVYLLIKQLKAGPKSYDLVESLGWILLTAGIALGGYWAYIELGWGGYWAWDPVENSSFIPWLAYTAYMHLYKHSSGSALMLITAAVTHFYSVIGTFITRSGIVLSVHTFANSDVAWYLQWYVWFALVCIGALLIRGLRVGELLKTGLDKVMFLNWLNLTFFSISILWGVLYGPFAEIFFEEKIILGIPFFEKISTPYFVLNFVLMSVGLSLWFGVQMLKLRLFMAIAGGFVVGLLAYLQNTYTFFEVAFLGLLSFNAIYLIQLLFFVGGLKKFVSVLIHLMVVVTAVGILFSYGRKIERNITLRQGIPVEIIGRTLTFERLEVERNALFEEVRAVVSVDGQILKPASRFYFKKNQLTAETAIKKDAGGDLYLALVEIDPDERWVSLKVFYSPLIMLVWVGIVGLVSFELVRFLVGKWCRS